MTNWPADKVERRSVASLIPYARNARTHSDEQVSQIAASIREFGFTNPILVDAESGIIAGHGRVLAAKKLGLHDLPVMIADGWSEAQKRAYVLADNKLALNAGWDSDLLKIELDGLKALDFDLALTGFSLGRRDLRHLLVAMRPGIARVRNKRCDRTPLNLICGPIRHSYFLNSSYARRQKTHGRAPVRSASFTALRTSASTSGAETRAIDPASALRLCSSACET